MGYAALELLQATAPPSAGLPDSFLFKSQDMWSMGCLLLDMLVNDSRMCNYGVASEAADHLTVPKLARLMVQSRHADWVRETQTIRIE